MASIKISELNEKTILGINDIIPIVDVTNNETKKITGANLLKNQYSTSEIKTNQKWINGKSIYRKVIYIDAFPQYNASGNIGAEGVYDTGITNMETPINMYGMYYDTSPTNPQASWPICNNYNFNADRSIDTRLRSDGTKITITYGLNNLFANYAGYVILEYTKTTD